MVSGVVVAKVKKNPPTVNILWNAMPDIEGFEESVESEVELLEDKWRRKVRYAWRMDLDVELDEDYFDEEDDVVSDEEDKVEECEGNDGLSLSSSSCGSKDSDGDNDDGSSESDSS